MDEVKIIYKVCSHCTRENSLVPNNIGTTTAIRFVVRDIFEVHEFVRDKIQTRFINIKF